MKVLFLGLRKGKKIHNDIMCQDITENFEKLLDVLPNKDDLAEILINHEVYKDFKPSKIFFGMEQQEAIEEFIKLYGKKVDLHVVK